MNIKRLEQIILSPFKLQTLYVAHFWLHHTAHCTEKILSAHLHTGSVSPESGAGRGGAGGGGAGGGGTGRDGTSRGRWLVLIRYVCLHKAAL